MIFNRHTGLMIVATVSTLMLGCPGEDENKIESGLLVHLGETHLEMPLISVANTDAVQRLKQTTDTPLTNIFSISTFTPLTAPGGYDRDQLEHHDITDNNSHLLSIYRAYLVLDEIELVACTSLSQLPIKFFNYFIPTAEAHAGHGAEPVGGRNLDKPNVIDIVTQDEFVLALGNLAVAPGSYCGIQVTLARLGGDAYGKPIPATASADDPTLLPDIPDMAGKIFAVRADYCSTPDRLGGCAGRTKVDIDDGGLDVPTQRTIDFTQPLEVNETRRSAYITLGIAYGQWAQDVDVSLLTSAQYERQKLLNNLVSSIHIYSDGLGDLPINVP